MIGGTTYGWRAGLPPYGRNGARRRAAGRPSVSAVRIRHVSDAAMEPADQRRDDQAPVLPDRPEVVAAMEPADQRRDDTITASS